jgi:hypothetical protein
MSAPALRRSAIQCFYDVGGNLDLMNEHAHWFEIVCTCECYAVLAFAIESIESGEVLIAHVYDLEKRETIPVDHPAIVLRAGHDWPPKPVEFDPERWCAETWSAVARAQAAFVPDGERSPPDLTITHLAEHLNVKYGVGIRRAEEIASRTRKDAGLDARRGRPKINSPAK